MSESAAMWMEAMVSGAFGAGRCGGSAQNLTSLLGMLACEAQQDGFFFAVSGAEDGKESLRGEGPASCCESDGALRPDVWAGLDASTVVRACWPAAEARGDGGSGC